jgi:hypothetical protein
MKKIRNESEERFRALLVQAGYEAREIQEPDTDKTLIGTADFLIGDVVFEVKTIKPTKEELKQIENLKTNVKNNIVEAMFVPDKTRQFKKDLADARKKFSQYTNYATVLVEDLTDWWWYEPDIEKMMFGVEAIHINSNTSDVLAYTWKDRMIRLDKNKRIGTYIFITASNILIYHNLMAETFKVMPMETIIKFMRITPEQFYFVNIPNSPALVRQIM